MSHFEDNLWRSVVEEHGRELAQTGVGPARHPRRTASRLVAGGSLGAVALATAGALLLSTSATTPAFAVASHGGSVSVKINRASGVAGANRKLASMGVHERIVGVDRTGLGKSLQVPDQSQPICFMNEPGKGEVGVVLQSVAQEQQTIHGDTWTNPYQNDAGNTGGPPQNGPWHVDACYANVDAAQAATTPPSTVSGAAGTATTVVDGNTGAS